MTPAIINNKRRIRRAGWLPVRPDIRDVIGWRGLSNLIAPPDNECPRMYRRDNELIYLIDSYHPDLQAATEFAKLYGLAVEVRRNWSIRQPPRTTTICYTKATRDTHGEAYIAAHIVKESAGSLPNDCLLRHFAKWAAVRQFADDPLVAVISVVRALRLRGVRSVDFAYDGIVLA